MLNYVAPILGVIVLVIVLINVIKALIRGFKKSLGSLVAIIVSALISAIITVIACNPNSGLVAWAGGFLEGAIPMDSLGDVFAIEELGVTLSYYTSMIVGPIFFLACYSLLSIILSIVVSILVKLVPILKKPSKLLHRLGGAGIGLVCGILVCLLVLSPVVGIMSVASGLMSALEIDDPDLGEIDVTVFEQTGFLLMFDAFSSADFEGERVYLRSELDALVGVIGTIGDLGGDLAQMDESQIASLRSLVEKLDTSPLLKNTVAGVFSTASEKWTAGESFLGIPGFEGGNLMEDVINELLVVMKTTDKNCIIADMTTMVDIFEVIINSGIAEDTDAQAMLKKLGDGVISDLLMATNKNPRMATVADHITVLSVKALASTLGAPADADERYDKLMHDVADALNQTYGMSDEERFELVRAELDKDFDHYGVHIEGVALDHATEGIIADIGSTPDASGEDVKEFFIVYQIAISEGDESASVGGGLANLGAADNGFMINSDGTVSVGGVVLKNYTAEDIYASMAYSMGKEKVDIGSAASLTDAEHMESTMITLDELFSHLKHYSDCKDVDGESERVGAVFAEMAKAFGDGDLSNVKAAEIMAKMGSIFDLMKASEIFGADVAQIFLKMVFQSESVKDAMGLSHTELNDFADKINNFATDKDGGYAEATKAVSGTIEAIDKAADKNATREEKKQASENMMQEVNHENKEMISSMVTGNMVNDFGVGIDNTDTVADSFKNLIYNMATYKDEERDEDEMSAEAHAVSKILTLATAGAGEGPMFDKDGVEGSVDSSSDDFIKTVVESEVVMTTVSQTAHGKEQGSNPYGVTYADEQEREDVAASLEKYYVENADNGDEELEDKLFDLALIMDVEIDLEQHK